MAEVILSQYSSTGNITWNGARYDADPSNVAGELSDGGKFVANDTNNVTTIQVGSDVYSKNWDIKGRSNTTQIFGGDGADTLRAANATATLTGGSGKDVFVSTAATADGKTVTLADYKYGEDVILGNFAAEDSDKANFTSEGIIKTAATGNVAVTATGNYYKVTMFDGAAKQNVWFGSTTAATLDGSAETSSLIMFGDNNKVGDLIMGGSKSDTIYAGVNDSVYGGASSDTIYAGANSVTVGLSSTSGADSVNGFGFGFATEEDASNSTVYLVDNTISTAKISYANGNVTVKDGSGSLTLGGATGDFVDVMVQDSTKTYKVSVASTNSTIAVDKAANYADVLVGTFNNAVSFAGYNLDGADGVVVDLGNTGLYGDTHVYSSITQVKGSSGSDELIGSASTKDSLYGGSAGNDSLWGGGSAADTLTGGDKGTNTFFYGTGDGKDVITNFVSSDKIEFISGSVTDMTRTTDKLTLKLNSEDTLTVTTSGMTDAADKIKINVAGTDYVAEVGMTGITNKFTYSDKVDFYYGDTKTDTLNVTGSDSANVWLDGSQGAQYFSVEDINAAEATGDLQLAGNTAANTITGGKGTSSIWGGAGTASDTLVGGTGENTFFFGMGNGNDVITTSTSADKVMLYDVTATSIKSASVSGGSMNIALTDGSTLKLSNYNSNSVNTFQLADGSVYTYDYTNKNWTKA